MKRKHFITSLIPLAVSMKLSAEKVSSFGGDLEGANISPVIPRYLKTGDTIGITAPAGYITAEEIQPAITLMENWGYKIRIGDTIGKKDFTFAGTDEERLNDFQKMLDDPKVKAIMCARG